ncbi:unannotated protein [freshwater metagenome]|uniref:Unannotated protein n=2 Tax=freshwater metagenome TaxID=449393 RepID=A0A6J6LBU0_9ZZZZ
MHTVSTAALDDIENEFGVQVALSCRCAAKCIGLIGEAHMEGVTVEIGVHRHGSDAHFLTGADDTDCNFAAVGDEDLFKHALWWHA